MDIYTYFFFSYGLTAIIAVLTVSVILLVNRIMNVLDAKIFKTHENNAKRTL